MNEIVTNPYLMGNYAPVHNELDINELEVIGEIPQELLGVYMRNGPNPAFSPISYTYPYDGDGMIHAVYIAEGKAAYKNRYVETKGLLKERKAGKALYGGVLSPRPLDPLWADPEEQPIAIKNGAFIHIIRLGASYLALSESFPAYQMTGDLKTLGEWNPNNTKQPIDVCAHTRLNRTVIDLDKGTLNHTVLDDKLVEFPRIREDRDTLPHQFIYTPTKTRNIANNRAFNALVKYDVKGNSSQVYDFGSCMEVGEAVFAPAPTRGAEDDGYLMLFVYDRIAEQSELVILDAMNFGTPPLARIKMPRRIPNGLHGSLMAGAWQ